MNDKAKSSELSLKISTFKNEPQEPIGEGDFISALILKQAGNTTEGDQLMREVTARFAEQKAVVEWMNAVYSGNTHEVWRYVNTKDFIRNIFLISSILQLR